MAKGCEMATVCTRASALCVAVSLLTLVGCASEPLPAITPAAAEARIPILMYHPFTKNPEGKSG